ncbi:MAG: RNB domain-containing ribonuclease, partial [Bacillota bacterium]
METMIYKWMKRNRKPASLKRMQKELNLSSCATRNAVDALVKQGRLIKSDSTRYALPAAEKILHGNLRIDRHGRMHFVSEDGERYKVLSGGLHGGRHEDTVQCRILPRRGNTPPQAVVKKVTEQAHEVVTGRYTITDEGAMVHCLDPRLGVIRVSGHARATDGDLVSVRITSVPADSSLPAHGTVESVLGNGSDAVGYLKAIAVSHGIPLHFEEAAFMESEALPEISPDDLKDREDLRSLTAFTIDGADAKDLDDAVSLETLGNGIRRLGVHIADVSHYVRPCSALDAEGFKRGNSTYLPGLTIPMLPERLSNGLCSLWPNGDKLTMSAILDYDAEGKLIGSRIVKSVIRSRARLTYNEVFDVLEGRDGKNALPFADTLMQMDVLRNQLKKARIAAGSLDFDLPEPYFNLGEDGWSESIEKRLPNRATQLIEEFMLAANRAVATMAEKEELPVVYRAHPVPDEDKTLELWN